MAIYYVATTGNDSNLGIFASPFLTIAHGMGVLASGDTLNIRTGTYTEDLTNVFTTTQSGTSYSNATTVQAYNDESVTINGRIALSTPGSGQEYKYFIFKNLKIDPGDTVSDSSYGIALGGGGGGGSVHHIKLDTIEITNAAFGMFLGGADGAGHDLWVTKAKVHDGGDDHHHHCFYIEGSNCIIEYSEAWNWQGFGIHNYGDFSPGDNIYRNNWIHETGLTDASVCGGILLTGGDNNRAYNNIVSNNQEGFDVRTSANLIYNNTLYGNGIGYGGACCYAAMHINGGTGNIVKNNIIFGNQVDLIDTSGSTGTIQSNNLLTDPDFVDAPSNDFHLLTISDAIDTGEDLTSDGVIDDIQGHFRPQGPAFDIGAYEAFFSAEDPSNIVLIKSDSPTITESLSQTLNPQGNLQISVADTPVASDRTVNPGGVDDLDTLVPGGSAQSGSFIPAENPKTYTLRLVDARIGANGTIEWDLVRGDIYPYDAFANPESPLLGAFIGGGSPPPIPVEDDQSDQSVPGAARLMLLDIPLLLPQHDGPGFYAAAGGINPAYSGAFLYEKKGDDFIQIAELGTRATMGSATELSAGQVTTFDISGRTFVYDDTNTFDVTLIDAVNSLSSTSDTNLLGGANACALGQPGRWEILEFGVATQIDTQKWTLSHLLRGLKGTEWAVGLHQSGDQFVLLNTALRRITDSITDLNVARIFRAVSIGTDLDSARNRNFTDTGISQTPLSPVFLRGLEDDDGNRTLIVNRRSRIDGLAGLDTYDPPAPLGETIERYEIDVYTDGTFTTVVRTISTLHESAAYSAAQQTADFGSVPSALSICWYQISETIGRGYAGCDTISVFDADPIDDTALVVESIAKIGEVQLHGHVTLSEDSGITLTQIGQNIAIGTATVDDAIEFVIDGTGGVVSTGIKGDLEIPFDCIINRATLLADQIGSIVVDVWKDSFANFDPTDADSITASAPPTISSAKKSQDFTLTGWSTTIAAGNILRFNVDSVATITRVTLSLKVTRTLLAGGGVRTIYVSDAPTATDFKTILVGVRMIGVFDAPTATDIVTIIAIEPLRISVSDAPMTTEFRVILIV